jgi:hypothetical protein
MPKRKIVLRQTQNTTFGLLTDPWFTTQIANKK